MFSEHTAHRSVVVWRVLPVASPVVRRRCHRCDAERHFTSSDRFRVNANGKRLDVWLIYRCTTCDARWNVAIHARASPREIGAERLDAYQRNDARVARRFTLDVELLRRAGGRVVAGAGFRVERPLLAPPATVLLKLAEPVRVRLDRLLAANWGAAAQSW